MTPAEVARLRLRAQGLVDGAPTPTQAVRRLLAVQGQDVAAPLAAVAQRTAPVAPRHAVDAAFAEGALVRTWTMRGTLHVIAPEDVAWLLSLTGARMLAQSRTIRLKEGVDDAELDRARSVVEWVLPDAGLPRPELLRRLDEAGVPTAGNRGYHVLTALAAQGVVHVGARDGTQYRFHPSAGRLPAFDLDRDAALARLAVRYVTGHAPATERDLAFWAGITLTDARRAVAAAGADLETVDVDGVPHLVPAGFDSVPPPPGAVHALPAFDELLIGYTDRAAVLGPHPLDRLVPAKNGRLLPFVALDGRVVGSWDVRTGAVDSFEPLDADARERAERAAADAAAWF